MTDLVRADRDGDVLVLTIDHPPVNAFSHRQREELVAGLARGRADDGVRALVIAAEGRLFSAGADIREFDSGASHLSPTLPELIAIVEESPKPVVVALHGTAVGGACELSLGCHGRVALEGTRIGLPEVKLGIVPGAGGTQRLPRVVGPAAALDVIVSGEPVTAEGARGIGLVDEVVPSGGDRVAAAVALARKLADAGAPVRTRDREDRLRGADVPPALFDDRRRRIERKARGFEAPFACIDCVEGATTMPFDEGMAFERETFLRCRDSLQSKAQRHAFFAEREARKVRDVGPDTPVAEIGRAAVLGCGTMGRGIAMCFAEAGIPVVVTEQDETALERGMEAIRGSFETSVAKGRLSRADAAARLSLIEPATDLGRAADADVVIEAVFEDMALKKSIFTALDGLCSPQTVLATNTSSLDVDEIAAVTSRPERVVGTHFFSPAHVMRLLEIVRADATSPETLATVMALGRRLGKVGVVVGVCDAFAANRMLYAYRRQADFLVEEGALPVQVDRVIHDFGFPMGPFALSDLAGVDVGWRIRQHGEATRPKHLRYSPIADRLYEMGRWGQKAGRGWYRYEEGSRTPIPDPEVTALIEATSFELGIERREIGDEEILERCLYPLVNEGAKILEEGIAERASDLDVVWLHGFGFPRYRGGPMFWADNIGLRRVYDGMRRFHAAHRDWLEPAPLLQSLARESRTFAEWRPS